MDYIEITNRVRIIKTEIHELGQQFVVDIQEKIQILKQINILLREQNHLLSIRQTMLEALTYAA